MTRRFNPYAILGTEPNMRQELINTIDGSWPEISKGQRGVLRKMRKPLVDCDCVDDVTGEPDRDHFCSLCLKSNSHIVTNRGIKKIKDIIPGERVLTGSGEYQIVTNIFARLYQGETTSIYTIGRGSIPLEMTSNHPVFVYRPKNKCHHKKAFAKICNPTLCKVGVCSNKDSSFNLDIKTIRADKIECGDYLVFPLPISKSESLNKTLKINWIKYKASNGMSSFVPPEEIHIDKDLMFILGWYIAEGSGDAAGKKTRTVIYSLNQQNEIPIAEKILSIFEKKFQVKGSYTFSKQSNAIRVEIPNALISRWLHDICGRYSKYKTIPSFIWNTNKDLQQEFLRAFMQGDGHRNGNNWDATGIVSQILAEEIYCLALYVGFLPQITFKPTYINSDGQYHSDSWWVSWKACYQIDTKSTVEQPTKWRMHFYHDNKLFLYVKEVRKQIETCPVYDLTVHKDHSFVANGILVHNCYSEGHLWDETFVDMYKVVLKSDVGNALLQHLRSPGFMDPELATFYVKYDEDITTDDRIIEMTLDEAGDLETPYTRRAIYIITHAIDLRADNGKLEYWKLTCFQDARKFLNGPTG